MGDDELAMRNLALVLCLILLASVTSGVAAIPAACNGLTGDALSRCLYDDVDARLRVVEGSPTPTPTPTTAPPATGDWLSGSAGTEAANGTFGTWRGTPVEIGTFWVNDPALYPIGPKIAGCGGCGEWAGFAGPVNISASTPTWGGWAAEASGRNDAYWTAVARKARELRAGKGQVYLNPYYEFNGDWMPYSVTRTAAGMADFRAGFARTAAILRKEFPGVKVVINGAAGRSVPAEMWPVSSSFDVIGVDLYNEWPHCATAACVTTFLSRITPYKAKGEQLGKPIAFPEWGNSSVASTAGGGGEAPLVIDGLADYFRANAGSSGGQVLYETYFNIGGYAQRFELWNGTVNPQMPNTVERYRQRF